MSLASISSALIRTFSMSSASVSTGAASLPLDLDVRSGTPGPDPEQEVARPTGGPGREIEDRVDRLMVPAEVRPLEAASHDPRRERRRQVEQRPGTERESAVAQL